MKYSLKTFIYSRCNACVWCTKRSEYYLKKKRQQDLKIEMFCHINYTIDEKNARFK